MLHCLLCFFRKDYAISMILGCLIANAFSPLGIIDVGFGTLATALAVVGVMFSKKLPIAGIFPVLSNAIIVGLELSLTFESPFWLNILTVGVGELVVIVIGVVIFMRLRKNQSFMDLIGANQNRI